MRVTYFQRKPIPDFHFSVEIIFNDIRHHLPPDIKSKIIIAKYFSKGIFKRIYIMVAALFQQGEINHITGDISFAGLFLNKRKTIQTILDCIFLRNKMGIAQYILKLFWLDLPVRRARIVTTISQQTKTEILKLTGCAPDKVKVIPIALSDLFGTRIPKPFSDIPKILLIGNAPNKNWSNMLEALKGIKCEIHVVAKQDDDLERKLKAINAQYIYQSGFNQTQMLEKYNTMDLLLFASTYEGFGMPIIEAQAVGVPVITSNISSMPEVAGNAAHLVNPLDIEGIRQGVLKIIRDEEYRNHLIQLGFENIKRFNPKTIAEQYAEIYREIAATPIPA